MKILLDLQGIQSGSSLRGIGRYSASLAKAMLKQAGPSHDISIMLNHAFDDTIDPIRMDLEHLIEPDKILVWQSLMPVAENNPKNRWRTKSAELLREQFIQTVSPDMVHISSLIEGICDDAVTSVGKLDRVTPTAVTHYDLIPYLNKEKYLLNTANQKWYFDKLESLKRSNLLLAISEASRQELITTLKLPEDKIVSISTDADAIFSTRQITTEQKTKFYHQYGITKKFIMHAGVIAQEDPRKNFIGLIRGFALLPQKIRRLYQLVLVGEVSPEDRSALTKQGKKLGLGDNDLIFTNYVNDHELVLLYNLCHLFVFPSLHEGFGLPVLEAMRCGAPVIASNCSSIPEVVGLDNALFDPHSDQSIADKMHQVLSDESFYHFLLEHSKKQATAFSWEKTAKRALEAFEALHATSQQNHQTVSRNNGADKNRLSSIVKAIKQLDSLPTQLDLARTALAIAENRHHVDTRQLFIDITHLIRHNLKSGIQRVVKNLLEQLSLTPPMGYQARPVYRQNGQYFHFHNTYSHDGSKMNNEPIEVSHQDIFLGLDLDNVEDEQAARFLNHHRQRGMKLYFVVYDILPLLYPELFPEGTESFFTSWFNKVSHLADGLIGISKAVAEEILTYLDEHPPKRILPLNIGFFHLGANIPKYQFSGNETHDISTIPFTENKTTFLMVGSIEPRKAYDQILDAMEHLWQNNHNLNLIIVGREGWHVKSLIKRLDNHPQKDKQLFWFNNASDELLKQLYHCSSALIMASKGEGFGLPLIEAAQHQLPIICRDIPVFKEVAGEHAFYFSGGDAGILAGELLEWQKLFHAETHPDSRNLAYINWNQSKHQLLDTIIEQHWYSQYIPQAPGAQTH